MAGVLAGTLAGDAARGGLARAREAARALESADHLGLDRADRVKEGLGAIVEVLEHAGGSDGVMREWVRESRRSVDAISTFTPLELQRAAVQDALRTTADAIAVLASERPGGAASATRSADGG